MGDPLFPNLPKKPRNTTRNARQFMHLGVNRENSGNLTRAGSGQNWADFGEGGTGSRTTFSGKADKQDSVSCGVVKTKPKKDAGNAAPPKRTGEEEVKVKVEKRERSHARRMDCAYANLKVDSRRRRSSSEIVPNLSVVICDVNPGEVGLSSRAGGFQGVQAKQWSLFLRTSDKDDGAYQGLSSEYHRVCGRYLYTESRESQPPQRISGFRKEEAIAHISSDDIKKYCQVVGQDPVRDGPHPWNPKGWVFEVVNRLYRENLIPLVEYQNARLRIGVMRP